MSTQTVDPKPAALVQIGSSVEDVIQQRLAEERARLEREAGLQKHEAHHFKRPSEKPFTREQRTNTTLLFGGLTWKHEKLVHGALEGLGYRAEAVPTPNVRAFQTGKEYGNNGQCNPTYFTVGNLVQYLQTLEEQGLTKQEIIDRYVFFTAGACGPCRFGMYEAEYRLALRNSGFDGFRVLLFQQSGGLSQSDAEAGLEMNLDFFLGILNALNCGDVMNEVAYAIRPYEVNAGETDQVLDESMDYLHEVFRKKRPWKLDNGMAKYLGGFSDTAEYIGKFVNQVKGDEYVPSLEVCRDRFNAIEIDRLRVKPIVKITGEFWAQTTEGDGNFNMFNFLQREGAQVLVEPIGTWIMYMIHQVVQKYRDFKGLEEGAVLPPLWKLGSRAKIEFGYRQKVAKLKLAEAIFKSEYHKIVNALGRHCASSRRPVRTAAPRPPLLQLPRGRRRRPSGSRQEHLLLEQRPGPHGPLGEAFRLHAFHAVGWRPVGGRLELQGHDLPADRDLRRGRDQRPQPCADGPRRGQEQGEEGIRGSAREDRPDGRTVPRLGGGSPRIQAPLVPGSSYQGCSGQRGQLRLSHRLRLLNPMIQKLPHRHGRRLDHRESGGD